MFVLAQEDLDRTREKWVLLDKDSLALDSNSIVEESFEARTPKGEKWAEEAYELIPFEGVLRVLEPDPPDSVKLKYRVLPMNFSSVRKRKDRERIGPKDDGAIDPYTYRAERKNRSSDPFDFGELDKTGNISRGINFGNTQDLSVNSNLNLELSGPLSDEVSVEASVTDDNIPVQPEGNTQQLRDFDKVFVRFFTDRHRLIAGDARIEKDTGHYLKYGKRIKGADLKSRFPLGENEEGEDQGELEVKASGAISKGKFARNIIQGVEGNQGPYRLTGADNERFIVVLAGTERVYIDGKQLERGEDKDYTIDYNAAELTFTPEHMIKQETRIRVEFQYSEQNYARSLFRTSTSYENDGVDLNLDIYSEQDAKGQPLQQDLTDADKQRLSRAGDDPSEAVVPRIERDSVYNNDELRYRLTDSLGHDSVFVRSTDPEEALFRLRFSEVGQGNGDYVRGELTPNGRAYRWVAPDTVNGEAVPQGNFAPVIPLQPPEHKRMVTFDAGVELGKRGLFELETAVSDQDQNKFSNLDNGDNTGGAVKMGFEQEVPLEGDPDSGWTWKGDLEWEHVNRNFRPIERIRSVEFDRDWNIQDRELRKARQLGDLGFDLGKAGIGDLGYSYEHLFSGEDLMAGDEYRGERHGVHSDLEHRGFSLDLDGSLLRTQSDGRSRFSRHLGNFEKAFPFVVIGYQDEHENNKRYDTDGELRDISYSFYEWEAYAANPDTAGNEYRVYYGQRRDRYASGGKLEPGTRIEEYGLSFFLKENPDHTLKGRVGHRRLNVLQENLIDQRSERSLVNRVEHRFNSLDGAIDASTFYQLGSGTERRKEFIYLEVPAGQGSYTWNDYNDNGVKELDEFEIARYSDQARYIRSFVRGDEYVQTYSNEFQHSLNIRPSNIWGREEGLKGFLSRFSEQVAYRVERKTSGGTEPRVAYDPFKQNLPDTTLLSLSSSFRNSIFFNRSDPVYGFEYTYRDDRDRSLLASGFQERVEWGNEFSGRWNFSREWGIECDGGWGVERNSSDVLDGRNYRIEERSISPELRYQPSTTFRVGVTGGYDERVNSERFGGQRAILRDIEGNLKYNAAGKGTFRVQLRYIDVRYSGEENSSLAFRMLESLEKGNNMTWELTVRRNLSENLQMDLNYNGRSSEEEATVHNGGVQVRAFF